MFNLFDFIIFNLSTCKSGKCWLFCAVKERGFRAQTPCASGREGGTVSARVSESTGSDAHPPLARRAFLSSVWENAGCAARFIAQKRKSESLQDGSAPVWSWSSGLPSSSIRANWWGAGGLCGAVLSSQSNWHAVQPESQMSFDWRDMHTLNWSWENDFIIEKYAYPSGLQNSKESNFHKYLGFWKLEVVVFVELFAIILLEQTSGWIFFSIKPQENFLPQNLQESSPASLFSQAGSWEEKTRH